MITEKEDARNRLKGALFGLILAVSSVMILRTINPQLTAIQIGDEKFKNAGQFANVSSLGIPADMVAEYERDDDNSSSTNNLCVGGLVNIDTVNQKGITVCKDISEKYKNMVQAAKKDGVILTAYGGRTMEAQIALRKKNCGTKQSDIYEKPSNQCSPQTARPGKSLHQVGLAFDIGISGTTICFSKNSTVANTTKCRNSKNPGFLWLEKNAVTYGFKNLPTEAWHWSTTGR